MAVGITRRPFFLRNPRGGPEVHIIFRPERENARVRRHPGILVTRPSSLEPSSVAANRAPTLALQALTLAGSDEVPDHSAFLPEPPACAGRSSSLLRSISPEVIGIRMPWRPLDMFGFRLLRVGNILPTLRWAMAMLHAAAVLSSCRK